MCWYRWCNQLDPNVNRAAFTHWEDAVIIRAWQVRLCCPHLRTTTPWQQTPCSRDRDHNS